MSDQVAHRGGAYLSFCNTKRQSQGYHSALNLSFASKVKCLAQEHNGMNLAGARARTARSRGHRASHCSTAPPQCVR